MIIGVLHEQSPETRVSLTPEVAAALVKSGASVWVERGAGANAYYSDDAYESAGCRLEEANRIASESDVLLAMHAANVPASLKSGAVIMGVYNALSSATAIQDWAARGLTVFSLDMLPRTTRGQAMDVLSSQANIAGYKAVLLAATHYSRYLPMFMTAAGSIPPAKVLVLGAGVAGLQAIATAKRLGAVVEVSDTRPAVKEEVMSLGAKFIEVEGAADASKAGGYAVEQSEDFQRRQKERLAESVRKSDIIISTAQIPGRKAPILLTTAMIESMRPGGVIVDMASATGGNAELTRDGEIVQHNGITIIGNSALAATAPADGSKLYAKNVHNFLKLIMNTEGGLNLNFEDDLVKGTCIVHQGAITNERVSQSLSAQS